LDDNESKVGLGIHVPRHLLNLLDLLLDAVIDAIKETVGRPATAPMVRDDKASETRIATQQGKDLLEKLRRRSLCHPGSR